MAFFKFVKEKPFPKRPWFLQNIAIRRQNRVSAGQAGTRIDCSIPDTEDESLITEIKTRARTIDLLEPFARIRHALEEAKNAA